jgi:hypothetical protein
MLHLLVGFFIDCIYGIEVLYKMLEILTYYEPKIPRNIVSPTEYQVSLYDSDILVLTERAIHDPSMDKIIEMELVNIFWTMCIEEMLEMSMEYLLAKTKYRKEHQIRCDIIVDSREESKKFTHTMEFDDITCGIEFFLVYSLSVPKSEKSTQYKVRRATL